ncbi:MAG TPA: RNase adapter RapZ [Desulfotomaculum sp.]|nr:MAG: hypothetical protein XD84_0801 [Desulfotomaculum sp. 46_80]KUK85017.1 MAG: hypothetical protein XE00_0368 [Desulfofundulus kuznetsovii]HAG10409.1 RNase adapter RapZ [Desulfotomaculum sp.]HBY03998.1 RNase adapter RapZ [Desulfotomaculum sp.]
MTVESDTKKLLPRLLIVTGLSGAGKTQALRRLEDLGFFCVDNLPPALIPKFTDLCSQTNSIDRLSLVVDIRGGIFFDNLFEVLGELKQKGTYQYEILFLEASDECLVRRFKESRRSHPLSEHGEILKCIQEERAYLQELRGRANKVIDTSELTNAQLKAEVSELFSSRVDLPQFRVSIISFGYKYGIPLDSDLVFDVRFLPNPHYVPELRLLTGNEAEVEKYVYGSAVTDEFMKKFLILIDFLVPEYIKEGKSILTIAIGCTGGRHRSVAIANNLERRLKEENYRVSIRHRDIKHPDL